MITIVFIILLHLKFKDKKLKILTHNMMIHHYLDSLNLTSGINHFVLAFLKYVP